MDWLSTITVLVSASSAVIAWVTKLSWSAEYRSAKNEAISAKGLCVVHPIITHGKKRGSRLPGERREIAF
jgi:hypothetical protein